MTETLIRIGWTLGLILLETIALSALLALWRLLRPAAPAERQYAACVGVFYTMVVLAAATPVALRFVPPSSAATPPAVGASVNRNPPAIAETGAVVLGELASRAGLRISPDTMAAGLGVLWVAGVLVLGCRLAGGALLAEWIRRRSVPVADQGILSAAEKLHDDLALTQRVDLRQSPHVEAPVVIGWRRVTTILPSGAVASLEPEALVPLLTHEFAHIRRADYLANLTQSIAEVPLFFSPAAIWISRRIRETREYCCDDAAVNRCGDPRSYINALMTLASLSTKAAARPALAASGPRLVVRVRRLLQAESTPRLAFVRAAALVAALVVVVPAGWRVAIAASEAIRIDAAEPSIGARASAGQAPQADVPYGYGAREDSGVELSKLTHALDQPLQSVVVRNVTIEPITAVRFAAVVEHSPFGQSVELFASDLVPVRIGPDEYVGLTNVAFPAALQQAKTRAGRVQVIIGMQEVRFANGAAWRISPNPAARDHREALGYLPAELTRDFLTRQSAAPPVITSLCRDQNGHTFSLGAVVGIRNEPGRTARCNAGKWEN